MHTQVGRVLLAKGDHIHGVALHTSLAEVIRQMTEYQIGALLVFDGALVVGIITERDLVRRALFRGLDPATTPVEEVMTTPVAYVAPEVTVAEAMKVMSETKSRHLPVLADGRLVGLVSLSDLIRKATSDLETQILYLESYIRGR